MNGIDGEDVPNEKVIDLIRRGYSCGGVLDTDKLFSKEFTIEYTFCGTSAVQGTDGGDGGCGGPGARSGVVDLFGLANRSNVISLQLDGKSQLKTKHETNA